MKPKIGIPIVDKDGSHNFKNYVNTLEEFSGEVVLLIRDEQSNDDHIDGIHGLLLPGGGDIDPKFYSEKMDPRTKYVNIDRDKLEIDLYHKAIAKDIPVFGICRGIQVMNVATGGSLHQHIDEHSKRRDGTDSEHPINIELDKNNLIGEIIEMEKDGVNSAHHQSLNKLGKGFVVTALCPIDDTIEAIEDPSKRFVVGVQYHPERMITSGEFKEHRRKLFEAFIEAAIEYNNR
ncbi:gamma-glutamyl-gamma-aminobutyrate hydrolase family protein [Candidatus Poribacteria bacterium]|nr:gamma-glutamyl-gamma-aminobutyrate hydrolase family protein [Candidatus Poribacteria bacterium]